MRSLRKHSFVQALLAEAVAVGLGMVIACALWACGTRGADGIVAGLKIFSPRVQCPRRAPSPVVARGAEQRLQAFWRAVRRGDVLEARAALQAGVPVDARDDLGNTALHYAAADGNPDLVLMLLEHHANIEATQVNPGGPADTSTPLIEALGAARGAAFSTRRGAPVNKPLLRLRRTVDILLRRGANIHVVDAEGYTPLMYAVQLRWPNMVRQMLARGLKVNAAGELGQTPIQLAVDNDDLCIARLLISRGANPNVETMGHAPGYPILQTAVGFADLRMVELLVHAGAKVNAQGRYGQTALSLARQRKYRAIERSLRASGARR